MSDRQGLFSYAGKVLRINLSNREMTTEPTTKYAREWMGASGIAVKIFMMSSGPGLHPTNRPTN